MGVWPGLHNGGPQNNYSATSLPNLTLNWSYQITGQLQNTNINSPSAYLPCMRSKTLSIRDNEVALIIPVSSRNHFGFISTTTGTLNRSFDVHTRIFETGRAEHNTAGIEGRDLRNGQVFHHWHSDGKIYFRIPGDRPDDGAYDATTGTLTSRFKSASSNGAAFFLTDEGSDYIVLKRGGHTGLSSYWDFDNDYTVLTSNPVSSSNNSLSITNGILSVWAGGFVVDGLDWYTLGQTGNPNFSLPTLGMVGAFVQKLTRTAGSQTKTLDWFWGREDCFLHNESDVCTAPKAMGSNTTSIVLAVASGVVNTATESTFNYVDPLEIIVLDKSDGTDVTITTSIVPTGHYFAPTGTNVVYFSSTHTFFPELAVTEDHAVLFLPKAVNGTPTNQPYTTGTQFAQLSVVDLSTELELWSYSYPTGTTTPNWIWACQNTRMITIGDSVYVVWIEATTPQTKYIDETVPSPRTLFIDKFDLVTGTKAATTEVAMPDGNTLFIDDLAAVDGKLYVLATTHEPYDAGTLQTGEQVLMSFGDSGAPSISIPVMLSHHKQQQGFY